MCASSSTQTSLRTPFESCQRISSMAKGVTSSSTSGRGQQVSGTRSVAARAKRRAKKHWTCQVCGITNSTKLMECRCAGRHENVLFARTRAQDLQRVRGSRPTRSRSREQHGLRPQCKHLRSRSASQRQASPRGRPALRRVPNVGRLVPMPPQCGRSRRLSSSCRKRPALQDCPQWT